MGAKTRRPKVRKTLAKGVAPTTRAVVRIDASHQQELWSVPQGTPVADGPEIGSSDAGTVVELIGVVPVGPTAGFIAWQEDRVSTEPVNANDNFAYEDVRLAA